MRAPTPIALIALLAANAAGAAPAVEAAAGWEAVDSLESAYGPYALLRRQREGSPVTEYRIDATLGVPVERAAAAQMSPPPDGAGDAQQVLRDDGDSQLVYLRISAPLIADRDLVLLRERSLDPAARVYRFAWRAVPEQGPPVPDGVMRIQRSEGSWEFRPGVEGQTEVRFTSLTDVGGRIPTWVINRVYRGRVLGEFEMLLRKLDALPPDAVPAGNPAP